MKACNDPDCPFKGEPQPLENFSISSRNIGGHAHQCKTCRGRRALDYNRTPEVRQAKSKWNQEHYYGTEAAKAVQRAYYKSTPPMVRRARSYVSKQVFRGKFPAAKTRLCVDCGKPAAHYHHHMGYEREHWMDVIPLCAACHKQRHLSE